MHRVKIEKIKIKSKLHNLHYPLSSSQHLNNFSMTKRSQKLPVFAQLCHGQLHETRYADISIFIETQKLLPSLSMAKRPNPSPPIVVYETINENLDDDNEMSMYCSGCIEIKRPTNLTS